MSIYTKVDESTSKEDIIKLEQATIVALGDLLQSNVDNEEMRNYMFGELKTILIDLFEAEKKQED